MKKVIIKNRSNGFVGYYIPEINLRRSFGPYEAKEVDAEEIQKVVYQSGGQELVDAYFIIEDKDLAATISPEVSQEPEYWMDKDNIIKILTSASQDEFLDFLDFCPAGALETVKDLAVSLPISDVNKMKAIQEKTGMNVYNAIQNKDEEIEKTSSRTTRRVQQTTTVEPPKYRRVEK